MSFLEEELHALAEENDRMFTCRLMPGTDHVLGVRLPHLRRIAARLAKKDWQKYLTEPKGTFEEIMVWGMLLGQISVPFSLRLQLIADFIPAIHNWSICDSCCAGLKSFRSHREEGQNFLASYAISEQEYEARFALVMYLDHYVRPEELQLLLDAVKNLRTEKYYAQMAAAWLVAECCEISADETACFLENLPRNSFIRKKSISKICDSTRIAPAIKKQFRSLR